MVNYAGAEIVWGDPENTITLLELMKNLMGISDSARDDELSMYLDMAGRAAESYIDNKLVSQEVTEKYAFTMSPIALRYYPADTLTDVTVDGGDETDDWALYTSDGVTWSAKSAAFRNCEFKQMSITYTAGLNPLPSEVGYALSKIAMAYESQTGSGNVKKEVINGVGSIEYVTGADSSSSIGFISPSALGVLERYRRHHV